MNKTRTEDLFTRWDSILREKSSQYEHEARGKGEVVTSPSIDEICNEMIAYLAGVEKK